MSQDTFHSGEQSSSPTLPPPPRRRRWLTALVMLVTFGCGLIVGGGATLKFIDTRVQEAIHHPERMPDRVTARLTSRLGLNEKQQAEVLEILKRRQQQLFAIRREVQPRVEAVLDGVEADVAGVLDTKQKAKWLRDAHSFRERFTPPLK